MNYEIKSVFFPWDYGRQHVQAARESEEWMGRIVHVIIAVVEMIPVINYIIAIVDRVLHPTWMWELTHSLMPDLDHIPFIDASDIDPFADRVTLPGFGQQSLSELSSGTGIKLLPDEVTIPGLGIRKSLPELISRSCPSLQQASYAWYEILAKQDTMGWNLLVTLRNQAIISRAKHPIMQSRDEEGNPMLIISRPTLRQPETITSFEQERRIEYVGSEVSLIFTDGTLINIYSTNQGECLSEVSRCPESSTGLLDFIRGQTMEDVPILEV